MEDALFAVCIVLLLSILSWLFLNVVDKLCTVWTRCNGLQGGLPKGVRPFSEIPGPRGLPNFGCVIQHIMNSKSIQLVASQKKLFEHYGPIFKETVTGNTHVYMYIQIPTDLEAVFKAEGKFPKQSTDVMITLKEYLKNRSILVVPSLGLLDNEEWSRLHKAMTPKLLRPKAVGENLGSLCNMTRDAIKHMVKIRETAGLENEIPDLADFLHKSEAKTVGILVFDLRMGLFDDPPNSETVKMGKP